MREIVVCTSHQSDWVYYKQPIKFPVVKVNGVGRSDPNTVQNGHIFSSIKEEIFIYLVYFDIFCGLG